MIGLRGVPATWGGVEHHVDQLGRRLVRRGHEVTVFGRTNYVADRWRHYQGMHVRMLPTLATKHLDAIAHSLLCTVDAAVRDYDIVHFHALGPGLCSPVARALGRARVVQTVHGLDNLRSKWGGPARRILDAAEWLSPRVPDQTIVVSSSLERHFRERHHRSVTWIPNGVVPAERRAPRHVAERFGLAPGYALFVGRLVPEKAPDLLLRAYRHVDSDRPLVIAGDSSFTSDYVRELRALAAADPRVRLVGYVFGDDLAGLYSNAGVFVLPSALEGLPLTLLEAASYGTPAVASDIEPHVEVLGASNAPARRLFQSGSVEGLASAISRSFDDPTTERAAAEALRVDVLRRYDWDQAASLTEQVYERCLLAA